ncbi:MAG: hypothetical protein B7Z15_15920, partial [Rhizobiales bacterium 32-66-8]
VWALVADVARLRSRVGELSKHFSLVGDDISNVLISADKIAKRGTRLEQLEFETPPAPVDAAADAARPVLREPVQ